MCMHDSLYVYMCCVLSSSTLKGVRATSLSSVHIICIYMCVDQTLVCVYEYVCTCMYIYIHIHIYMYIYICPHVCMYV